MKPEIYPDIKSQSTPVVFEQPSFLVKKELNPAAMRFPTPPRFASPEPAPRTVLAVAPMAEVVGVYAAAEEDDDDTVEFDEAEYVDENDYGEDDVVDLASVSRFS